MRSAEDSLKRRGVDHVDVLQIVNGHPNADPRLKGRDYAQLRIDHYFREGAASTALNETRAPPLSLRGASRHGGNLVVADSPARVCFPPTPEDGHSGVRRVDGKVLI